MASNGTMAAPERELARSVKRDDRPGILHILIPRDIGRLGSLPPRLPADWGNWTGFFRPRDVWALSAPYHAAMWASALGIAVKKRVSLAWEVNGDVPIRYKRAQQWLLNAGAGMGLFGWVPFLSMGLRSYYGVGIQYIEIERASPANGSRIINIHHLNPLRCRLTGYSQEPVQYMSQDGKVRSLKWHEVMIITSLADPTEGDMGIALTPTEQAWPRLIVDEVIERYVFEKASGQNPSQISFIGGAFQQQIDDAMETSQEDASRKGNLNYMGTVLIPVAADVPLSLVTVDLASIPDKTDVTQERNRSDLIYALVLDLDPQDINPQLIGRQGLGSTGNQSLVLADKNKGNRAWEQQFTHQLNELALDDKTMFSFIEVDFRDKKAAAELRGMNIEAENAMIESGILNAEQARNNLVDSGDLPRAYLENDITPGGTLSDTDKPIGEAEEIDEGDVDATAMVGAEKSAGDASAWGDLY